MAKKSEYIFVVVPSTKNTGPIKGAVALCNGLSRWVRTVFVVLKNDHHIDELKIKKGVDILSLAQYIDWVDKYRAYTGVLKRMQNSIPVSVSFCYSADIFNSFMGRYAKIASIVRGNLIKNYRIEFGPLGTVAALTHYAVLRRFNRVFTISNAMQEQLRRFGVKRIERVGNFLDEEYLEYERLSNTKNKDAYRFIFLGRLMPLKRPDLLMDALIILKKNGIECKLDLVGNGSMKKELEEKAIELGLRRNVRFHGYMRKPYNILQKADCLVLPSETEGISRAALEALFFGIPVVMRRVDGNHELITPGINGELFMEDSELPVAMGKIISQRKRYKEMKNLLPQDFRQDANIERLIHMINR